MFVLFLYRHNKPRKFYLAFGVYSMYYNYSDRGSSGSSEFTALT